MSGRKYDVIVVGGSFAGLNFSRLAALSGLEVLVLERHCPIGSVVNTTGVLPVEVLELIQIPRRYLKDVPRHSLMLSPTLRRVEMPLPESTRWYMSDTGGVLAWLAEIARDAGAEIREGMSYLGGRVEGRDVVVEARDRENAVHRFSARFIAGADGALSRVARNFGLSRNEKLLSGYERVVTGVGDLVKNGGIYAVFDNDLAPGYGGWLAKIEGDRAHLGVAGYRGEYSPARSLDRLVHKFRDFIDPDKLVLERSLGGLMPVGGILPNVVNEHAILLGDAAGMCGGTACDGIFPSLLSGMAAARIVTYYIQEGDRKALGRYVREFGGHFNMGANLKGEAFRRRLLEFFPTNRDLEWFVELWSLSPMQRALMNLLRSHRYAPTHLDWIRYFLLPALASPAVGWWIFRYFLWRLRGRATRPPFCGPLLLEEGTPESISKKLR